MDQGTEELAKRFVEGCGLLNVSLDECVQKLEGWRIGCRQDFRVVDRVKNAEDAIAFLSRLTFPACRHAAFRVGETTAFVNNSQNGSDFADYCPHFPMRFQTRAARFIDCPKRVWSNGKVRETMDYEARIFELFSATGQTERSVCCANDGGRWCFDVTGTPHPVEHSFPYDARRKKDRLTSENLRALSRAYGLSPPSGEEFLEAQDILLFREDIEKTAYGKEVLERACTPEQRDDPAYGYYMRGLGWVRHMDSHAQSVLIDLQKAVQLNPEYEPLVRSHINEARRILSQ